MDEGFHGLDFAEEYGPAAFLMRARKEGIRDFGACMSPTTAFHLLQGIETLGLRMPTSCAEVPDEVLNPRDTWDDPEAYDEQAAALRDMFRANYDKKGFADLGIAPAM